MINWIPSRLKILALQKAMIRERKTRLRLGENVCKLYNWHPVYVKNSQNLTIRK